MRKIKNFVEYLRSVRWKIKDYDRLEHDYACVLDHATCGRMSKTNYKLSVVYSEIDDTQQEVIHEVIKSDLIELLDSGADMEEIREYINKL